MLHFEFSITFSNLSGNLLNCMNCKNWGKNCIKCGTKIGSNVLLFQLPWWLLGRIKCKNEVNIVSNTAQMHRFFKLPWWLKCKNEAKSYKIRSNKIGTKIMTTVSLFQIFWWLTQLHWAQQLRHNNRECQVNWALFHLVFFADLGLLW